MWKGVIKSVCVLCKGKKWTKLIESTTRYALKKVQSLAFVTPNAIRTGSPGQRNPFLGLGLPSDYLFLVKIFLFTCNQRQQEP